MILRLVSTGFSSALGLGLALAFPLAAQTVVPSNQLPTGGQVSAGQASISQSGNTLTINQTSNRAVVDWNTFNVGSQAQVYFQQPNAQSATLNRVADNNPSQILGRITATGQVVLVNPQGVYFGKSATVDVGGLVATTHNSANQAFMDGQMKFDRQGATGKVVNEGELRAALNGYIALLAPEVRNSGVIVANLGTVALAAGEAFELQFETGGGLTGLRVTAASINTLVENQKAIKAPGGLIILSAQAVAKLRSGVVNNGGLLEANGLSRKGGRIILEASTRVNNSGTVQANATPTQAGVVGGPAGAVSIKAPEVVNTGTISATSVVAPAASAVTNEIQAQVLGQIQIQAEQFSQTSTGVLDVSAVGAAAGRVSVQASQTAQVSGQVLAVAQEAADSSLHIEQGVAASPALGGVIEIAADQLLQTQGAVLDASGANGAGRVHLQSKGLPVDPTSPTQPAPSKLIISNTVLRANSSRSLGGRVELESDELTLDSGTLIEAKGATGGGTVLVGGDWQGSGSLRQATTVAMSADSVIDASATDNGQGGKVVLWSDVKNANSVTTVNGTIYAKGGVNGGDGGRVETSGHQLQVNGIRVNTSATDGSAGSWLLDPFHMVINANGTDYTASTTSGTTTYVSNGQSVNSSVNSYIAASTIQTALASNNVTVQSSSGYDIISQGDGTITYSGGTARTLTLNSGRNITLTYDSVTYPGGISGTNLSLVLQATGSVSMSAAINVGGNVTINTTDLSGSGAMALASGKTLTVNQSGASTYSGSISGSGGVTKTGAGTLNLSGTSIYTGNTNISAGTLKISGHIYCANTACSVEQNAGAIITISSGATFEVTDWGWQGSLGSLYFERSYIMIDGGTLRYSGLTNTSSGHAYTITANGGTLENASSGTTWGFDYAAYATYNPLWSGNVKFAGAGNIAMSQIISGAINVTKEGAGTLTLNSANSYTGTTTINGGVLKFSSTGTIYASDITTNLYVNSGGVLDVYNWGWYGSLGGLRFDKPNLVINGGTIRYSGVTGGDWRSFTVGTSGATFDNPTAGVTWSLNQGSETTPISGNLTFSGAGSIVMGQTLTGSGYSLTKSGTGTLTLSGSNTYTGGSTVSAGTLKLGNAAALGGSSSAVSVTSGAVLDLNGQTVTNTNVLTLNGTGISSNGALVNGSATTASYAGNIALASDASVGTTTTTPSPTKAALQPTSRPRR